jgi:hypothetical protein
VFAKKKKAAQAEFWVATQLAQSPKSAFYARLDETLESFGFADKVRALGAPAYKESKGGMRRTTLRGWENLNKRFKLAAAFYNLSQLMRKLFGFGTPKQLAAVMKPGRQAFYCCLALILTLARRIVDRVSEAAICAGRCNPTFSHFRPKLWSAKNRVSSTGC